VTRHYKEIPIGADGPLNERFENLAKATLELWHVPGIAIAVVDGDKTWAKVFFLHQVPTWHLSPLNYYDPLETYL